MAGSSAGYGKSRVTSSCVRTDVELLYPFKRDVNRYYDMVDCTEVMFNFNGLTVC